MSLSVKEIAWIAAIFEGEGSFGLTNSGKTPAIWLSMTDKDIVERVRDIIDPFATVRISSDERKPTYKDSYRFYVSGKLAASWMMIIYSLMGTRRKAKITECLIAWKFNEVNSRLKRDSPLSKSIAGLSRKLRIMGFSDELVQIATGLKHLGLSEAKILVQIQLLKTYSVEEKVM